VAEFYRKISTISWNSIYSKTKSHKEYNK